MKQQNRRAAQADNRRPRPVLWLALFVPFLLLSIAALDLGLFLSRPVAPEGRREVVIAEGAPLTEIARQLADEAVVSSDFKFRLLARLRGETRHVQAGRYAFEQSATPGAVLDRLVAGDVIKLRLTIPEGLTVREIAGRLQEAESPEAAAEFRQLARDPDFARSLGVDAPGLEGYIFPDTYFFTPGTPPARMLETMVRQFRARLSPELIEQARLRKLNVHELVTLASIIQKETGRNEEMPLISAVFHNRLRRGMPLQADPTVIYGIPDFNGNLTRKDLATPTPYNTYRRKGLPPGPIASPGTAALRAAANPADAGYLYFVARGDGTHVFSATLKEHNLAVRRYQLRR